MIEHISNRTSKLSLMHWALDALYYSQGYRLLNSKCSGVGAIFTLHHVIPAGKQNLFTPNRILEITPDFLEQTIKQVRALDYDIVSLDEVQRRLVEKDFKRKFICFTLDDGYVDSYNAAFPVFKKHNAEFTLYVATGIPDGSVVLWWRGLEKLLLKQDRVELILEGKLKQFSTVSPEEKYSTYYHIYWALRHLPLEEQYATAQQLFDKYGIDSAKICRESAISWDMLAEMSQSKLVTIAAHTVNHFSLSKLSPEKVQEEATLSREIIAQHLGINTKHFSYPYGDAASATNREFKIIMESGFATATTTRKGVLFPEHAQHLHALPRVSLNGAYQKQRYVRTLLSGAPFALLYRHFRPINVN